MNFWLSVLLTWFALSIPVALMLSRFIATGHGSNETPVQHRRDENQVQTRGDEKPLHRRAS